MVSIQCLKTVHYVKAIILQNLKGNSGSLWYGDGYLVCRGALYIISLFALVFLLKRHFVTDLFKELKK